ncbi:MAG: iron-containing alcohol dehydrogenase [Candidatus Omnitrophota bacterium]
MLNFTFHVPTTIYFGKGQVVALEEELKARAKKVLIVTGRGSVKKHGIFDQVIAQVKRAGADYVELTGIQPNPRLKSIHKGIELCRKEEVDFILAAGGGSTIDAAKAIAVGVKYKGDVWDFFEKKATPSDALPVGTVLTLSATGSEMNPNAVITNEKTKHKTAISTPLVRPVFSVLDPEYTFTVNKYHTAAGVADIMAHIFENYLTPVPGSDVQDRMAEALLKICIHYGPVVCEHPEDYNARANIMWASSLALNGTIGRGKISDWACHAIEHEVSAYYDISHGAGLAVLLPNWMRVILKQDRQQRFLEYGINVWGVSRTEEKSDITFEAMDRTREFFDSLGLPSKLDEFKVIDEYFENMADRIIETRPSMEHFRQLSREDIIKILDMSL